ncbi:hypothetical protein ACFFSQ_47010 [Dactylosporangium matsuzakiense]|uniref:hypothetical protein n=1 Tax=Dactylosporangium matsuzakiense TaxID=53360 RepID=UPI0031EBFAB9
MPIAILLSVASGMATGLVMGYRWAVATRTYRDARATTRAARGLWRQVPRDWSRVGAVLGWVFIVGVLVVAYFVGKS